jgi:hypothetical protein
MKLQNDGTAERRVQRQEARLIQQHQRSGDGSSHTITGVGLETLGNVKHVLEMTSTGRCVRS